MLKGRLGLETSMVPHSDRHGLIWLQQGRLFVEDGTLRFETRGGGELLKGNYAVPFQTISLFLLGPGSTVSHDALRLLARHGCGLLVAGGPGRKDYASMPLGPNDSALARRQARAWANPCSRERIARRMLSVALGEDKPGLGMDDLRATAGRHLEDAGEFLAVELGLRLEGAVEEEQVAVEVGAAYEHASRLALASAMVATASTGTIPQLGFLHEDSSISFCLDLAKLLTEDFSLPVSLAAARDVVYGGSGLESAVRLHGIEKMRRGRLVPKMIEMIKCLFEGDVL